MLSAISKLRRERNVAVSERDDALQALTGWENKWKEERENCKSIVDKANELIARWDQPSWKDTAPTARFINALRIAVRAYEEKLK
jgi:hypothetical protein